MIKLIKLTNSFKRKVTLGEISRRNCVKFAEWFINNEVMTKEKWFELQKEAIIEMKKDIKIRKNSQAHRRESGGTSELDT